MAQRESAAIVGMFDVFGPSPASQYRAGCSDSVANLTVLQWTHDSR